MRSQNDPIDGLQDADLTWLAQIGTRRVISTEMTIIDEGVRPNALFLVLHGSFGVRVEDVADEPLAKLGAGELIGEISFLEGSPASATIVAEEPSVVLVIDTQQLSARMRADTAFASRLYRAFALIGERRLRDRVDHLVSRFEIEDLPRASRAIARLARTTGLERVQPLHAL